MANTITILSGYGLLDENAATIGARYGAELINWRINGGHCQCGRGHDLDECYLGTRHRFEIPSWTTQDVVELKTARLRAALQAAGIKA